MNDTDHFHETQFLDIAVEGIEQNNCILLLGPRFALNSNGEKLHEQLRAELRGQAFDLIDEFENLFILRELNPKLNQKLSLHLRMKDFHSRASQQTHEIYQKIARIPFRAVVSCTHDLFLKTAFEEQGLEVDFQYFRQRVNPDVRKNYDLPILYNVFGSIEDKDSLIFTYDRFSDFLISILSDHNILSTNLKHGISESSIFILIGFDMESWYYPLVLRKLKFFNESGMTTPNVSALVNQDNYAHGHFKNLLGSHLTDSESVPLPDPVTEKAKRLYYPIELDYWKIDTVSIIESIYERVKLKGILRQKTIATAAAADPTESQLHLKLKNLVIKNDFDEAFKLMNEAFERHRDATDLNALLTLQGQFNLYRKQKMLNLISEADAKIAFAQITHALLILTDELAAAMGVRATQNP